jgi:hypothetical protein
MTSAATINAVRHQIAVQADVAFIQIELLELLYESLKVRKDSWGTWEKVHFSIAITALTLSIHAHEQPSHAWLEVCLRELEKAVIPTQLRDSNYCLPDGSVQNARHKHLMDALECLRRDLEIGTGLNAKAA